MTVRKQPNLSINNRLCYTTTFNKLIQSRLTHICSSSKVISVLSLTHRVTTGRMPSGWLDSPSLVRKGLQAKVNLKKINSN